MGWEVPLARKKRFGSDGDTAANVLTQRRFAGSVKIISRYVQGACAGYLTTGTLLALPLVAMRAWLLGSSKVTAMQFPSKYLVRGIVCSVPCTVLGAVVISTSALTD